ncbi:hypothetical protein Acr_25g0003110 [Actinidia rufa]|uniref:Uncharacterized protein n=1 Tax=Actinidia rufa TaxID=165716 RepID=A0A7J0GYN0_9ERIC|nr:hypothetical protein Acr_25g0003110 [Actinidia rufa]
MDKGEDVPASKTALVKGDKGESRHSQDEHPQNESPRAMSRRISLKKLGQNLEEFKSEGSVARSTLANGVVICEKCPKDASTTSPNKKGRTNLPNKKGKTAADPKGKETAPPPEAKKAKPRNAAIPKGTPVPKLGDGPSANPSTVLGPRASILEGPSVIEKILSGVVPPVDKERVE